MANHLPVHAHNLPIFPACNDVVGIHDCNPEDRTLEIALVRKNMTLENRG